MANTTWSPTDQSQVALSGGNLIATSTTISGNWVRSVDSEPSGQFYWEVRMTTWSATSTGVGLTNKTASITGWNATGLLAAFTDGHVYLSGVSVASGLTGTTSGAVIGFALDVGARLAWVRVAPAGNWNGSGTANPATGTGGISISAITGGICPIVYFATNAEVANANFGDSAFSGSVPSGGFASGFPGVAAGSGAAQARVMMLA